MKEQDKQKEARYVICPCCEHHQPVGGYPPYNLTCKGCGFMLPKDLPYQPKVQVYSPVPEPN